MYKRMLAVFISIVIIMTTCSFRLMYLTSGSDVQAANNGSGYKLEISRGRGTIYDCNLAPTFSFAVRVKFRYLQSYRIGGQATRP